MNKSNGEDQPAMADVIDFAQYKLERERFNDEAKTLKDKVQELETRVKHVQDFYAVRIERLKDLLRDTQFEAQALAVLAYGTADPFEPPTYTQIIRSLRNELMFLGKQLDEAKK